MDLKNFFNTVNVDYLSRLMKSEWKIPNAIAEYIYQVNNNIPTEIVVPTETPAWKNKDKDLAGDPELFAGHSKFGGLGVRAKIDVFENDPLFSSTIPNLTTEILRPYYKMGVPQGLN